MHIALQIYFPNLSITVTIFYCYIFLFSELSDVILEKLLIKYFQLKNQTTEQISSV
jgi:hypothetical protein